MIKPGCIVAVAGSSQSGKTAYTRYKIDASIRALTWDVEGQYPGEIVTTKAQLLDKIEKMGGGAGKISYRPPGFDTFGYFCEVAYLWGLLGESLGNPTTIVAEETSDVTSPAKAPAGWGPLLRRGKKRGITIYAVTQRLSESDKTAIGNADYVHLCRLVLPSDREYMKNIMDLPVADIAAMKADQDKLTFDYFERDLGRDIVQPGTLTFGKADKNGNRKPKFSSLLH